MCQESQHHVFSHSKSPFPTLKSSKCAMFGVVIASRFWQWSWFAIIQNQHRNIINSIMLGEAFLTTFCMKFSNYNLGEKKMALWECKSKIWKKKWNLELLVLSILDKGFSTWWRLRYMGRKTVEVDSNAHTDATYSRLIQSIKSPA